MHDIWILLTRCNLMKEPLVTIQPRLLLVFSAWGGGYLYSYQFTNGTLTFYQRKVLLKIETSHYCGYTENLEKLAEISIWFFFAYFIANAVVGPESIAVSKFYLQFNKLKPQGKMLLVFHLEKANIIIEQITAIRLDDVLTMWDSLV